MGELISNINCRESNIRVAHFDGASGSKVFWAPDFPNSVLYCSSNLKGNILNNTPANPRARNFENLPILSGSKLERLPDRTFPQCTRSSIRFAAGVGRLRIAGSERAARREPEWHSHPRHLL